MAQTSKIHEEKEEAEPLLDEAVRTDYGTAEIGVASESTPRNLDGDKLITYRVIITLINYGLLAFCDMSYEALIPLMYSTSIENGGLALPPRIIGIVMGCIGVIGGVTQIFVFAPAIQHYGPRKIYIVSLFCLFIAVLTLPSMNYVARQRGQVDRYVYLIIAVQILAGLAMSPAYCEPTYSRRGWKTI